MAKKISYSDIAEGQPFDPLIEGGKELVKVYESIIAIQKDVLAGTKEQAKSNSFGSIEEINEATQAMKNAKKEAAALTKTQQDLKDATERLSKAQAGEVDELTAAKLAVQAANQETKRLAKEQMNLGNAYDQASAKLNNMRRSYKDLVVQGKEFEQGTQDLLAEITKLDGELKRVDANVGQFQRSVGNYGNAFGNAFGRLQEELAGVQQQRTQIKGFGKDFEELAKKEAILTDITNSLNKEFKTSVQQSRAFQEAARKIGFTFGENSDVFQKFKNEVGEGVDAINDINDSIKLAASDTRALDRIISAAQGIAGAFSVAEGAAALFGDENEDLQKTMVKLQASMTVLNGLQSIQAELKNKDSLATKGLAIAQKVYSVAVGQSTGAMKGFRVALLATGVGAIIVALGLLIANFDKIKSVLGFGVNPATRELAKETEKAAEASKKAYEAFEIEERRLRALETAELDVIRARRTATEEYLQQVDKQLAAQEMLLSQTLTSFAKTKAAGFALGGSFLADMFGTSEEDLKEVKDKYDEVLRLREDLGVKLLELDDKEGEELRRQRQQIEDLTLSNMQEGLAKALAAEKLSYERRREELGENYEAISLLTIGHEQNVLRIQKEFADKRLQEEFKYRELLVANMRDGFPKLMAEEQLQYDRRKKELEGNYRALEQLAIQHEVNMMKIVKDRNQVPEEIKSKQREVSDILKDGAKQQEDALKKSQEGVTKWMEENARQQEQAMKRVQRDSEKLAQAAQFYDDLQQKRADKRLAQIDKETEASKKRADDLRQLALQGDKNAQQSIAAEEKRQAELERRREKEAQKAKRRELLLTGINTYNAKVQAGDKNALGSTLRDLTLLAAALNAIPGFYEGTEFVGANGEKPFFNTGKDDYLYRGHKGERILTADQNGMIGADLSNDQLAQIANMYQKGQLIPFNNSGAIMALQPDFSSLEAKLDQVNDSIRNMPDHSFAFDQMLGIITHTERRGQTVKNTVWRA